MSDPEEHVRSSVHRANEVVGLYGDPLTTWGIGVELLVDAQLTLEGVTERLDLLVREFPHLGRAPVVTVVADGEWAEQRERALSRPFGGDGYLVRLLVDEPRRRLVVAAHHGVIDGLGLLAVAEAVAQIHVLPHARGLGTRSTDRSFVVSGLLRVAEALVRPPLRLGGRGSGDGTGEWLEVETVSALHVSTADICWAVAATYASWPGSRPPGRRPLMVLLGASRRAQGTLAPDRQTAYMRFPLAAGEEPSSIRARLARLLPEPDFPETSVGGIGPRVTRALRNRLGGTAMISNLGRVTGTGLVSAVMYPALNGPQAVSIGVVTTEHTTTVSVRTRRSDFSQEESRRLVDTLTRQLGAPRHTDRAGSW